MSDVPSGQQIVEFWRWFGTIARALSADFKNATLLDELDRRMTGFGKLMWEIGPGKQEENALVISPDGSKEWLATTQRMVAMAPSIESWEFHWARPPKDWDLQFRYTTRSGDRQVSVDARPWRYVLWEYPDGSFDILIEENNVADLDLDDDDQYTAAVIALEGIIGEALRIEFVGDIEVTQSLADDVTDNASAFPTLPAHLAALGAMANRQS